MIFNYFPGFFEAWCEILAELVLSLARVLIVQSWFGCCLEFFMVKILREACKVGL